MIRAKLRCASAAAALLVVGAGLSLVADDAPPALVERTVKALGKLEGTLWGAPLLSPNGERMAWVMAKGLGKLVVVCDGKEGPEYQWTSASLTQPSMRFSPDGKRFVYAARKRAEDGDHVWVCDRVEIAGKARVYLQGRIAVS